MEYCLDPAFASSVAGKLVSASIVDPPLGPETEAFFDLVLEYLAKVPPSSVPMGEDVSKLCDPQCGTGAAMPPTFKSFRMP
jgi:hypothetical protein